jgi:hypothetical protein
VTARRIGLAALLAVMAAAGWYVFVYLYRWEWNRAQVSAAIFIALEVGLVGWLLSDRLRRVERRLDSAALDAEQRRLAVIRTTAPPPRTGFAWLAPTDRMDVFIPVLLGAGAVLSGVAWTVERLARVTAGRRAEVGLARRLAALELPAGGLLETRADPLALLRGPVR